jgi:hypothetical protein
MLQSHVSSMSDAGALGKACPEEDGVKLPKLNAFTTWFWAK